MSPLPTPPPPLLPKNGSVDMTDDIVLDDPPYNPVPTLAPLPLAPPIETREEEDAASLSTTGEMLFPELPNPPPK